MIVIFHNIRSLFNVGALFRTADAAGVTKLFLTGYTPAPVDLFGKPRFQLAKVSLGAETYVLWEKQYSAVNLIKKLKKQGWEIWAIEQTSNSIPYYRQKADAKKTKKIALIVGNEVRGLSSSILRQCHKILEIPMLGKKESLNVAVAFGIVAFALLYSCRK